MSEDFDLSRWPIIGVKNRVDDKTWRYLNPLKVNEVSEGFITSSRSFEWIIIHNDEMRVSGVLTKEENNIMMSDEYVWDGHDFIGEEKRRQKFIDLWKRAINER